MTYAVMDECIKYKYKDCIEGCLVDCFYQDEKMIVIKTEECIGYAVCETEYPDAGKWIAFNQKYIEF
jgi:NAD-dependent dihydropyrimidine dehydrogenase PreA subunit